MADYFQVKNQNIFNPPANTSLGNATNQFNDVYVQNDLVLGNVTVTGTTIIAPRITTITYPGDDTAADTAGGQTITLTGTGFVAGASVLINGSAVGVVSVVSSTTITFVSPANTTGSYVIYVINPDGSTAIAIPGIQYSGTPTWTTAAGTLGNVYETANFNQTVTATGDAPITYSVVSGSLPPGSTFNANGTITGTSQLSASPTTYSFTVRATDAEQQDTNRAFSIAVIPDVVTWSNPTNNTTYSPAANIAIANITLSATSAVGSGITYSANTLPTGLSLTGANISGTPTVQANTSSLLTATANTTSESSSITINWVVSVASDPYFMYNSLLLPGTGTNGAQNNTFLDASTNNFAITRNGNTTQGTFSPYGPNWSNYFDGSSYTRYTGLTAIGTNDYTIELWFFAPSDITTPGYGVMFDANTADLAGNGPMLIFNTGTINFKYIGNNTPLVSANCSVGVWHHVAMSKSGTGSNNVSCYLDGVRVGQMTYTTSLVSTIANIGVFAGLNNYYYTGYVSNVRVVSGTALYSGTTITVPTSSLTAVSGTTLLACQTNRFVNSSNVAAIVSGTPTIQRFSPFSPTAAYSTSTIGGSGYLSGASSTWLAVPINATFAFGTNNYTYEAWVYPTSFPNAYNTVFCNFLDNEGAKGWSLLITSTGLIHVNNQGTYNNSTNALSLNMWTHIAVCRVGNTVTRYINGVADPTTLTVTASITNVAAQGPTIGGSPEYSTSREWNGYISDARVVSGTALYTSNFTPSTTPLTAVSGTSLLLNYTNAGIIDNTMLNNLETVGNAQISTAQSQFGGGSMSFDGTGDYMIGSAFSNPTRSFGTGNFTIEGWFYINANKVQIVYDLGTTSGSSTGFQVAFNASGYPFFLLQNSTVITSSIAVSVGTWAHVAWVRNNGTCVIYVNGTSGVSTANSANLSDTGLTIGTPNDYRDGSSTYHYNGYIDDLRITKGIARYTSNFTPPIAAFPTY